MCVSTEEGTQIRYEQRGHKSLTWHIGRWLWNTHVCPGWQLALKFPLTAGPAVVHPPEEELLEPALEMTDEIFHSRCCGGRPRGEGACRPAWGDGRVEDKAMSVPRLPRVFG